MSDIAWQDQLRRRIADHAVAIEDMFTEPVKVTIVIRNTKRAEGGVLVTNDDHDLAKAEIDRLSLRPTIYHQDEATPAQQVIAGAKTAIVALLVCVALPLCLLWAVLKSLAPRGALALLLALLPAALALAQEPQPAQGPAPTLQASTYAELSATTVQVTGLDAEPQSYMGAQYLAQAGFGPWALAVRGRVEGLPAEYKSGEIETFRSAEGYLSGHYNWLAIQGVTCGPAATVGYAVALDKGHPTLAHNATGQVGIHCASGSRTVLVQAGSWQPLPGVSGTVAVIWPLSDRISWHGDFGTGARGQRVFRIAVAVTLKAWGKR